MSMKRTARPRSENAHTIEAPLIAVIDQVIIVVDDIPSNLFDAKFMPYIVRCENLIRRQSPTELNHWISIADWSVCYI